MITSYSNVHRSNTFKHFFFYFFKSRYGNLQARNDFQTLFHIKRKETLHFNIPMTLRNLSAKSLVLLLMMSFQTMYFWPIVTRTYHFPFHTALLP